MPFRIPLNYTLLDITATDPRASDLKAYIAWLANELALAKTMLDQVDPPPKASKSSSYAEQKS